MTFPNKTFKNIHAFANAYFEQLAIASQSVDKRALNEAASMLGNAYDRRAAVYVCGNGGSASISNHLICDHLKGVQTDTHTRPRIISLSSNIEILTAIANDISYEDIFTFQLSTMAEAGDILITISSSGDSENIVRAAQWAKSNACSVIAMTGFNGGRSAKIADINLHVEADNYGVIEDAHQSLMHILAQFIRLDRMENSLIAERRF